MARTGGDTRVDRWFRRAFLTDVGPDRRISAWSPIVLVRMAVIGAITVAVQFDDVEGRTAVTLLLLAAIAAQPIIARGGRSAEATWRRLFVADLAFSTAIALVARNVATNHVLVMAGLIGAAATCFWFRGFLLFAAAAIASASVVLVASDVGRPEQGIVMVAVVGLGFGAWMLRARVVAESARRDRQQTLDAAGGVFVFGLVGDSVFHCDGDLAGLLGGHYRDGRLDLRTTVHPEDIDDFWLPDELLVEGFEIDRTARFRTDDGGWRWIRESSRVVERNGRLEVRGLMLDHTDQLDGLLRARTEATTDSLTGLANRRVLVHLLDRDHRDGRHLVLFDLDGFKRVNDTLGHEAGDELLKAVAQRIGAQIRSADLLVRLGGDEFALVIDETPDPGGALAVVDRILDAIAEPVEVNGVVLDVEVSAGMVREDADSCGSRTMLRRADLAMYAAKRSEDRRRCFSIEMEQRHGRMAQLVQDLPAALATLDLRLFFQPIVDIRTGRVVAAEGLARWEHPAYGLLTPAEFLDVVLVSSQAVSFTREMVGDAIEMASRTSAVGLDLDIAVNVPTSTIEDPAFARWFFERCDETAADPSRIVFETSERELHHGHRAVDAIDEFAARGVTMAIDDFGTGHSTFERLRWRQVSQLKLDHRIVQGAATDARDAIILQSVVDLAKRLGYTVVGEGVESEAQRAMLAEFGVDLVQGYLFAPALDRSEFLAFAAAGSVGNRMLAARTSAG